MLRSSNKDGLVGSGSDVFLARVTVIYIGIYIRISTIHSTRLCEFLKSSLLLSLQ